MYFDKRGCPKGHHTGLGETSGTAGQDKSPTLVTKSRNLDQRVSVTRQSDRQRQTAHLDLGNTT